MTKAKFDQMRKELDDRRKELSTAISRTYRIGAKVWVHIFSYFDYTIYLLMSKHADNKEYLVSDYQIAELKSDEVIRFGHVKKLFEDWCAGTLDELPESDNQNLFLVKELDFPDICVR